MTLATDGVIGANGGPRSPGTAYILLHHVHGRRGRTSRPVGLRARRHGRGVGSHCRRRRAAAAPRSAPTPRCERILVRDGRARGVVLEGGEEIEAALVASNLDPAA